MVCEAIQGHNAPPACTDEVDLSDLHPKTWETACTTSFPQVDLPSMDAAFYLNLGLLTTVLTVALAIYTRLVIKPTLERYG